MLKFEMVNCIVNHYMEDLSDKEIRRAMRSNLVSTYRALSHEVIVDEYWEMLRERSTARRQAAGA